MPEMVDCLKVGISLVKRPKSQTPIEPMVFTSSNGGNPEALVIFDLTSTPSASPEKEVEIGRYKIKMKTIPVIADPNSIDCVFTVTKMVNP